MRRSKSSNPTVGLGLIFTGVFFLGISLLGESNAVAQTEKSGSASSQIGIAAPANDPCFLDVLCKGHYQRARAFSKAGELDSALTEYQIAFKQQPVPWLLLNIARTLHKIPRLPEAIEKYQRYLDMTQQNGDAELRGKAQEYLEQAKKELAERPPPEKEKDKEPSPAPLVTAPLVTAQPTSEPERKVEKPIYKKWSYKKNFGSDGGRFWNGTFERAKNLPTRAKLFFQPPPSCSIT